MKKYKTKEVADLLNISKATLLRWIRQGKIKDVSRRNGRGWRVWLDEDIENARDYHSKVYQLKINFENETTKNQNIEK